MVWYCFCSCIYMLSCPSTWNNNLHMCLQRVFKGSDEVRLMRPASPSSQTPDTQQETEKGPAPMEPDTTQPGTSREVTDSLVNMLRWEDYNSTHTKYIDHTDVFTVLLMLAGRCCVTFSRLLFGFQRMMSTAWQLRNWSLFLWYGNQWMNKKAELNQLNQGHPHQICFLPLLERVFPAVWMRPPVAVQLLPEPSWCQGQSCGREEQQPRAQAERGRRETAEPTHKHCSTSTESTRGDCWSCEIHHHSHFCSY